MSMAVMLIHFGIIWKKQGGTLTNAIKWNFSKFVIDKEGQPVARFSPMDDPIPKVEESIKKIPLKNDAPKQFTRSL